MNDAANLVGNMFHWRNSVRSLLLGGQPLLPIVQPSSPFHGYVKGDPCPPALRVVVRALLRESFRLGNHSAPLSDPLLDVTGTYYGLYQSNAPRPRVSVLIPVRGAHKHLALCLRRLGAHSPGLADVVIACAEAERDIVESIVASWIEGDVRVVTSPEPQGYPANVNLARRHARGDVLVLLNSDSFVTAGWLGGLMSALAHDGVVAAGPTFQAQPKNFDPTAANADRRIDAMAAAVGGGRMERVRRLVGFCMAIKASAFDAVGGICEDFGIGNWDDDDLSLRLSLIGDLVATPSVKVIHPASQSFRELPQWETTYNRLLAENEKLYHARWGWILPDWAKWLDGRDVAPAQHNIFHVEE